MSSGRFPIRPLDYANRNLAVPKELLVDYEGKTLLFSDENNNIMHTNFDLPLKKEGPVHLLDLFGANQQEMMRVVGQAMENPGKIFRATTQSGGREFGIKTLQLTSKGGIIRTLIILEPLAGKK